MRDIIVDPHSPKGKTIPRLRRLDPRLHRYRSLVAVSFCLSLDLRIAIPVGITKNGNVVNACSLKYLPRLYQLL